MSNSPASTPWNFGNLATRARSGPDGYALPRTALVALAVSCLCALPAWADISGTVRDADTNAPIAGARVHVQADIGGPEVLTAADGSFTLPVNPPGAVLVAASITYDPAAPVNYTTNGVFAVDGETGVTIELRQLPTADNPAYDPPPSNSCGACHPTQESQWALSNHAVAAVDTWVRDLFSGDGTPGGSAGYVFTDTHDPGETGFCATCHAPMADVFDPGNVRLDDAVDSMDPGVVDGISCVACHQMADVNNNVNGLHHLGNTTYRFPEGATQQYVWGPLDDVMAPGMEASFQPLFAESRFCASCHQYNNPNTGAPGQTTYTEWLASPWAVPGPNFRTCQTCHMTEQDPGNLCVIGDERPSEQRHTHEIVGATPESLAGAIFLAADVREGPGELRVRAEVTNAGAGHSFPTGVSIRNALLVIEATHGGMPLTQTDGPTVPFYGSDDVPGEQPGDYAGHPGKGFAKVLQGRINGAGPVVRPVLFIDAESVWADTAVPSGTTDVTEVTFALPPGIEIGEQVDVRARLLYRRAYRALAVTKGWTETPQGGPIEIEVGDEQIAYSVTGMGGNPLEIPALGNWGLVLLGALMALAALGRLRRRSV